MKTEQREKILKKFNSLKQEGTDILKKNGWDGRGYHSYPNDIDYKRFRAESLNIVRKVCGDKSDYYLELRKLADTEVSSNSSYYFKDCLGIVEATAKDFESGYLLDVRALVLAELLGDFIDQAKVLCEQGYHVAAASLAGAVLEDTLRTLSKKNGIEVLPKTTIDKLNTELARKEIYTVGQQKRITSIADVRNKADHGKFAEVKKEDVEDMIQWVSRFTVDSLE